jgi:hypothetical protein
MRTWSEDLNEIAPRAALTIPVSESHSSLRLTWALLPESSAPDGQAEALRRLHQRIEL